MQNLSEKLTLVQNELKAPKNQRNNFGNFNYRNCEDILEAVKPLLKTHGLTLVISDKLVLIGDRYYIEASANLTDGADSINNTAYAREEESKKGMDASQLTGSTSSYAPKYALNGLFCIDDTKDADSMDNSEHETPKADEKEWYNDFESHKETMIAKIQSGESTGKDIVKKLRETYKVSKKVAQQIEELG